jgi:hypothetical protein
MGNKRVTLFWPEIKCRSRNGLTHNKWTFYLSRFYLKIDATDNQLNIVLVNTLQLRVTVPYF